MPPQKFTLSYLQFHLFTVLTVLHTRQLSQQSFIKQWYYSPGFTQCVFYGNKGAGTQTWHEARYYLIFLTKNKPSKCQDRQCLISCLKATIMAISWELTPFSMVVFWVMTSSRLVGGYQCFRGSYCLHLQPWRWRQYVLTYKYTQCQNP
jgi:hypothetical protein